MSYFIWLEIFKVIILSAKYVLNDVQNKLIILQLRVLGLIENLSRGLGQRSFTVIANVRLIP